MDGLFGAKLFFFWDDTGPLGYTLLTKEQRSEAVMIFDLLPNASLTNVRQTTH